MCARWPSKKHQCPQRRNDQSWPHADPRTCWTTEGAAHSTNRNLAQRKQVPRALPQQPSLTQAAERARARTRGQSKKSMKKLMKKFKNLKKAAKSPAEKSNKRTKVRLCCGICNPNNLNLALAPHTLALLWRTMTHHS